MRRRRVSLSTLLVASVLAATASAPGVTACRAAEAGSIATVTAADSAAVGPHQLMTLGAIRAYQKLISPSRGTHCPMTPHCSKYGFQAFSRHNPLVAWPLTADRLHRCGHDIEQYPLAFVDGQLRFSDPLEQPPPDRVADGTADGPATLLVLASARTSWEPTEPSPEPSGEAQRLFRFAQSLEIGGDLYRAATEYSRLIHYYPGSTDVEQAYAGLARCHYGLAEFLEVVRVAEAYYDAVPRADDDQEMRYTMGLSYFQLGNYPRARETFATIVESGAEPYASKATMLAAASFAHQGDWEASARAFEAVPSTSPFHARAVANRELASQAQTPDHKNPRLAGILGVVPGLGYLYAGYRQTALSAFLVNGAFIWATVEAFDSGQNGLGAVLGVLSFGWYSGNIYGSVRSAHRHNQKIDSDYLAKLQVGFAF